VEDSRLDLFLSIAALGEHEHLPRLMGAEILFSVSMREGRDDEGMCGVRGESMGLAIPLALEGYGLER